LNVAFEIRKRGLEKLADLTWITNEYEVGDFGMGGAFIQKGGYVTSTKVFTESILSEYGIKWIKRSGVTKVEKGLAHYENLDGEKKSIEFDFSMLIPAFSGQDFKAFNKEGEEITERLFAPNGFMKVDADYTKKPYEDWSVNDWPSTYHNPENSNSKEPPFSCLITLIVTSNSQINRNILESSSIISIQRKQSIKPLKWSHVYRTQMSIEQRTLHIDMTPLGSNGRIPNHSYKHIIHLGYSNLVGF